MINSYNATYISIMIFRAGFGGTMGVAATWVQRILGPKTRLQSCTSGPYISVVLSKNHANISGLGQ